MNTKMKQNKQRPCRFCGGTQCYSGKCVSSIPFLFVPVVESCPMMYDFRGRPEPEKTLRRVEAVLSDARFSHGERAAAALLALKFMGGPDTQTLSVKKLLSESSGFSAKVRNTFLAHMTEAGLISVSFVRGVGSEITLNF